MKVYVAGRVKQIPRVQVVRDWLREEGHSITFDWTGPEGEQRSDWSKAPDVARGLADRERRAVLAADVVVLVGWGCAEGEGGLGCFIEVGVALALGIPVVIVGPCRESVFWYLPAVQRVDNLAELKEAL